MATSPTISSNPLAGLPVPRFVHNFSTLDRLSTDAARIYASLEANRGEGNQWIIVLGLSEQGKQTLDNDKDYLGGIAYRFQWVGSVGIIKIISGFAYSVITSVAITNITGQLSNMGLLGWDIPWGGSVTYKLGDGPKFQGKQADQVFTPRSRHPSQGTARDWPTLVIETGVSESYPKLITDIKWWFQQSGGRVNMAIAVIIGHDRVRFERWQLRVEESIHDGPLDCYQGPKCVQGVVVTAAAVLNAPMIIPFQALYDRAPNQNETDVVLTAACFRTITRGCF